jgi:hypothetical protein
LNESLQEGSTVSATKFINFLARLGLKCIFAILLTSCGAGGNTDIPKSTINEPIAVAVLNLAPISICPNGGITVQSGVDTNANNTLEVAEASSTQYVCNGTNGSNGSNGLNGINGANGLSGSNSISAQLIIANEAPGGHCSTGGSIVSVGLDLNSNSILDNAEIISSNYICNGSSGSNGNNGSNGQAGVNSLVAITTEPLGNNCLFGGAKASSGLDTNANNVLDSTEITSTTFICSGATGATGITGATGGGLSAYAYIYNLTEQTVEVKDKESFDKSAVAFDSNGLLYGVEHKVGSRQIVIRSSGYYFVAYSISGTQENQFAIFVNEQPAQGSVYGSGAGTQQTYGQLIVELKENDVLRLVNFSSSSAVDLASVVGGTQANVNASIIIQKLN